MTMQRFFIQIRFHSFDFFFSVPPAREAFEAYRETLGSRSSRAAGGDLVVLLDACTRAPTIIAPRAGFSHSTVWPPY